MPHDLPLWAAVYQQAQRKLSAGCFEQLAEDLRAVLRLATGRKAEPSAAILDSRTLRARPESGERAGDDGTKRKQGSKLHIAVDTVAFAGSLHLVGEYTPPQREADGRLLVADRDATPLLEVRLQTFDNVTVVVDLIAALDCDRRTRTGSPDMVAKTCIITSALVARCKASYKRFSDGPRQSLPLS